MELLVFQVKPRSYKEEHVWIAEVDAIPFDHLTVQKN